MEAAEWLQGTGTAKGAAALSIERLGVFGEGWKTGQLTREKPDPDNQGPASGRKQSHKG